MPASLPLRRALLVGCALFSLPASALAQEAVVLDTVTVEGSGGGAGTGTAEAKGPVNGYVAKATTTGSKSATPLAEVPQSVSVIGQEELSDRGVQKVDEALRYSAGIFSQPFGEDTDTDWVYIRGFDATQTGIFLDGLQLYQFGFGGFIIDPFLLERVEVLRGPASVLYGGSNDGGIVNSISKRANGDTIRYVEGAITQSPNGYGAFDLADRITPDGVWSFRLLGKLKGGETETDYADNFRGLIAPNITYQPDEATRLNLYATFQADEQRHTGGFLPYAGSVVDAPFGRIPRDLFYSEPDVDQFQAKQATVGYEFEHELNESVTLRSNSRYADVHRNERSAYPFGYTNPGGFGYALEPTSVDSLLTRLAFAHDTQVGTFTTDNQAEFKFETGPVVHTLLTGLDYKYYNFDQVAATGFGAAALSPIRPNYTNNIGTLNAPYADEELEMNQVGVYAQDQMKFGGGWIATLNGRYDEVWIDRDDRRALDAFLMQQQDYSSRKGSLSGRAGLGYEFENGLVPYLSVSHSFNPQIGTDSAGNPVEPLESDQYEVGLKYAPTFLDATFTASLFDLTRNNVLQTIQGTNISRSIGKVNSRGVELEANVNLDESWRVKGAFTAFDLEIEENGDPALVGKRPYTVPDVLASLWLDYTVRGGDLDGLSLGGGLRYIGSSFADNENTLKVPSATVFDAAIRYDREDWGVSLNVNNVFDKDYVAGCQGAYTCNYAEDRSGLLKAHLNF